MEKIITKKTQKSCIIILCKNHIENIPFLLKNLDEDIFDIFINIDCEPDIYTNFLEKFIQNKQIKGVYNIKGCGRFNGQIVTMEIELLSHAFKTNEDYKYFIFLSDDTFVLQSKEEMKSFFEENNKTIAYFKNTENEFAEKLPNIEFNKDIIVYKGSQFIALINEHVKSILKKDAYFYEIYDIFKDLNEYSCCFQRKDGNWDNICPDECFFQTYLCNDDTFKNEIRCQNLMYFVFIDNGHAKYLNDSELRIAQTKGFMFARKYLS